MVEASKVLSQEELQKRTHEMDIAGIRKCTNIVFFFKSGDISSILALRSKKCKNDEMIR